MLDRTKKIKIVLGSASPRRQQLLKEAGLSFDLRLKQVDESYPSEMNIETVPGYLSSLKAKALLKELQTDELLITADTVVVVDNRIVGKPKGREEAIAMLNLLSGKKHVVITGVCLSTIERSEVFSVKTDVYFSPLSQEDIIYYVDNYAPFDKAGAYGIQEWIGFVGIERIDGSFYNVMGLPIHTLLKKLRGFGWKPEYDVLL